jgi:tRNA threonylcarbamoyl adenosine modification protein YeaZ
MHSYIIIHHTYQTFEVALIVNNFLHRTIIDDKRLASKMLIFHIDSLLKETNILLTELSFIGINQGPGLFSTLRSIITTANALYFAHKTPLIGIDALDATAIEFYDPLHPNTIVLLDAFNYEIYYAITKDSKIIKKSYDKIDLFLNKLVTEIPQHTIRFIGKGAEVYKNIIRETCKKFAFIPEDIPQLCSINTIAILALDIFIKQSKGHGYLFPLHLKKHPVELI